MWSGVFAFWDVRSTLADQLWSADHMQRVEQHPVRRKRH